MQEFEEETQPLEHCRVLSCPDSAGAYAVLTVPQQHTLLQKAWVFAFWTSTTPQHTTPQHPQHHVESRLLLPGDTPSRVDPSINWSVG